MASTQSKLLHILLRLINKKNFLKAQFAIGKFDFYTCIEPPQEIAAICNIDKYQLDGHNVFTIKPKDKCSDKHILYLHGGAYVKSFAKQHWKFFGLLIKSLKCTITAPDYPLAPKYTYQESFAMLDPLYKKLISMVSSNNFILMGDSAGGGFALALAQKMRDEHENQPKQIILLSPWLDLTLSNPDIKNIDPIDPFLGIEGLMRAGKAYAGNTKPDHYLLSPINGPLEGLGKISLFVGSNEILVADARKLKALAESKGIYLNYFEYEDMVHVWMLLNLPESKKAKQEIIDLIQHS
ncbi:alpha/beta hydrolase [Chitinophagaceae bacterium LB-8]|uniref:Alpha/beta hydrolase n=1 Tax=Paraflavisolibacter caeni TaxID=2982496 RepID=A0A9X2Y044_9BACT|nr:alpha/beta hydrolase [Paraflavisolibacter caeni]MCU7552641.1 alpha/beta hydrolase [Paraflavisolibacter caeni]